MNFSKPISTGFHGDRVEFTKMNKKRKRVGRGTGSGMGKTSTRGSNGQKARSGCALSNFQGGQKSITSLPMRGFKSTKRLAEKFNIIHLSDILIKINDGFIDSSQVIDSAVLAKNRLIKNLNKKNKILFDGDLNIKIQIKADSYSRNVIEVVQKFGGSCL
jgi:large subunit ribosomal protein L15